MKSKLVVLCLLLCSAAGWAQQSRQPATPAEIQKLIEVLRIRQQIESMQAAMMEQGKRGARDAFLDQYPHAKPELLAKVDSMFVESFGSMISTGEFVEAVTPIYQKYFTHDDVVALVAFYSSAAGQHFLEISPKMMQEAAAVGGSLMEKRRAAILARMEEQQAALMEFVRAHPELAGEPAAGSHSHSHEEGTPEKK